MAPKLKEKVEPTDIDLLVIKDTEESFIERLKRMAQLVKTWEALDLLVYTPEEWERGLKENNYFLKEIEKTGRTIYARDT